MRDLQRAVEVAIHFDHLKLCCLAESEVKNSSEWFPPSFLRTEGAAGAHRCGENLRDEEAEN